MEKQLTVNNGVLVGANGEPVLLRGVNVVNKDPGAGHLFALQAADWDVLERMQTQWVRLGIFWDALEPQPGVYDDVYLEKVAVQAEAFAQHGILVVLDMHQDLYGQQFADGAPDWATLTRGKPHKALPGMWSSAYLMSPAVQTAIDNFWSNAPASDGVGLQVHLAGAWQRVAARFARVPYVVGYDLYNEPIPGSGAKAMLDALMEGVMQVLSCRAGRRIGKLEAMLTYAKPHKLEALLLSASIDEYDAILARGKALSQVFDRAVLQPFFEMLRQVIRREDPRTLLFFCNGYFSNLGIPTALEALGGDTPDPYQVYAPHGYDLVVDTDMKGYSQKRVDLIFSRHAQAARRMGVPMAAGEWGGFSQGDVQAPEKIQATRRLFASLGASDMLWQYIPGQHG